MCRVEEFVMAYFADTGPRHTGPLLEVMICLRGTRKVSKELSKMLKKKQPENARGLALEAWELRRTEIS